MEHREHKSITEKYLRRGDVFALEFSEGLILFEVDNWEQLQYRPYTQIGSISSQDNSGFARLDDSNGNDVLYVEEGNQKVLHAAIGQRPQGVRRYTNYPEGENRLRTFPNLNVPSSRNGDDYGFVDGNDSPFDAPTDAEELWIPPAVHLDFDFYNPNQNDSVSPVLNITGREYNVTAINPEDNKDLVRNAMRPGGPIPKIPAGSSDHQISYNARTWDVEPKTVAEMKGIARGDN